VVPEQEAADAYATAPLKAAYDLVVQRRKVGQFLGERSVLVEPPRTEVYYEELARIPVRWVSLRDPDTKAILARTGTVKSHARKVGVMTMALDYSPGQLVNVRPLPLGANYVDLLPPRLSIYGHSYEEVTGALRSQGVSHHLNHKGNELKIIGRLSGYGLEPGYHSANVQVGSTRYVMWGQVRTPGGGAHLECWVSVPVGLTTLTATVPGLPPATLSIKRDPPGQPQVDLAGLRANLDAAFRQFGNNPAQASKVGNACDAYADGLARLDRYHEVYELYQNLFRTHPNWLSDTLEERLYEAAFRVGDVRHVLRCGRMRTDRWIRNVETALQSGSGRAASDAGLAAYRLKNLLRRFVSTGGDAATAEKLWQELRRMEALSLTQVSSLAIHDGLSIDFGPRERR
jgi:hypothetical protein